MRGMVHTGDPSTSYAAARAVKPSITELQYAIVQVLAVYSMTAEELETLECFKHLGPSTVRKRVSELYHLGVIEPVGKKRNSRNCLMIVWRMVHGQMRLPL
jgi:hypothetical protein